MIISFYSYKGGVGRTQLTANLATFLCHYAYKKVLLIDWDLEAPGLHFYFKAQTQNKGVIELLTAFNQTAKQKWEIDEADLPYFDQSYIVNVDRQANDKGRIDLITAGFYDNEDYKEYNKKVTYFNWQDFYEKLDGLHYTEFLKQKIKELGYDYVLIDSRTGMSDYLGMVNIQLPDINVLVMAPTNQNLAGCKRVANNIKNSPYVNEGYRKPTVMPILSRMDTSIEREMINWRKVFAETFQDEIAYFCQAVRIDSYEYVANSLLAYKRDISFGENIVFAKDGFPIEQGTIAEKYRYIAQRIEAYTEVQKTVPDQANIETLETDTGKSELVRIKKKAFEALNRGRYAEYFKIIQNVVEVKDKYEDILLLRRLQNDYINGETSLDFHLRLRIFTQSVFRNLQNH